MSGAIIMGAGFSVDAEMSVGRKHVIINPNSARSGQCHYAAIDPSADWTNTAGMRRGSVTQWRRLLRLSVARSVIVLKAFTLRLCIANENITDA